MDEPGRPPDLTPQPAKRFGRRETLKLLGASLTGAIAGSARVGCREPAAPQAARRASAAVGRRGRAWRLRPLAVATEPRSFTAAEIATLAAAVGRIIPDTDTPGARTSGVHWYLDDVCTAEIRLRDQLRAGLRRLDERARAQDGSAFADLAEPQQVALLEAIDPSSRGADAPADDRAFFELLKAQTIDGYYKSEMGQIGELEWVGHEFNDEFPGACSHGDPLVHPRPSWPRSRP